ncbi:MAG: hypothetical protein AB7N80_14870 [Bdellovibrionales bacterium]
MAKFKSSPTNLKVYVPGNSALAKLAASMPAGSWAKLDVSNQNAILGVGSVSGSMLHYCNSAPWNAKNKSIEILGQDHNYPFMRHVRYDEVTNQFVLVADNAGIGSGHGYDHSSLNPTNGDLYTRLYSGFSGKISVRKKAFGTANYVDIPSVPATDQVAIGTCWWSGSFVGGGAQGSFMVFNSGNSVNGAKDGHIAAYNPLTNTWFFSQEGCAPNYGSGATYHSVIEYSSIKNVAVYGGGNVASNRLWRLSSDASIIAMPNVPTGKAVGIQSGNLVNDPVTGNFLLLSGRELWELNPDGAGKWTQQTGSRVPPADAAFPGPGALSDLDGVVSCAIPEYGVVVYIKQKLQTGGNVYLYKHA